MGFPLHEKSRFSGKGVDRGYVAYVFWEPKNKLLDLGVVLRTIGVDIEDGEAEIMDPFTEEEHEYFFMNSPAVSVLRSPYEHVVCVDGEHEHLFKDYCEGRGRVSALLEPSAKKGSVLLSRRGRRALCPWLSASLLS